MSMRMRLVAVTTLVLAGCAGFEPRVSVQTEETRPVRSGQPPAVSSPKSRIAIDYTVVRGDTLYGIAFRNKIDFRDLAAWNNINAPYTIYPGQGLRLKPPSRTTRMTDPSSTAIAATPRPTVAPTPSTTAAPSPVDIAPVPSQPIRAPEMATSDSGTTQTFAFVDDGGAVSTSQTISPVAGPRPPEPVAAPTKPAAPETSTTANSPAAAIGLPATAPKPVESAPVEAVPAPNAPAVDTAPRTVVDANAATRERDGLRWRWPAVGNVVGRFVEGDPTQQGIDIGGSLGHIVLAAADGDVVYSGNGLLGYGELVIVQHNPGYLSAYGHNQKRLVVEGNKVKAGQPIAEMGRRGGIDMLHFEIRRNGKPVDPLGYLPNR